MSMVSMVNAMNTPMGDVNSLFKNPAANEVAEVNNSQAGVQCFMDALSQAGNTTPYKVSVTDPNTGVTTEVDVAAGMGRASDISTAHLTDKCANLSTQLPMLSAASKQQAANQAVDAIAAGTPSTVTPPSKVDCPPSLFQQAFQTIRGLGQKLSEMASAIASVFSDWFSGLGSVASSILNVIRSAIPSFSGSTIGDIFSAIGRATAPIRSAITSALSTLFSASQSVLSSLGDVFTSVVGHVSSALSSIVTMIRDEAAVIANAIKSMINTSFLTNVLNSEDPCVKQVVGAVVNTDNVDQKTINIAANRASIQTGAELSQSYAMGDVSPASIDAKDTQGGRGVPIPSASEIDAYSSSEINSMNVLVSDQFVAVNQAKMDYAAAIEEYKTWKDSVGYETKRTAAIVDKDNPDGRTTDPVIRRAWIAVRDQAVTKQNAMDPLYQTQKIANDQLTQMSLELKARTVYGRHYVTYLRSKGVDVPPEQATTLLDSTT